QRGTNVPRDCFTQWLNGIGNPGSKTPWIQPPVFLCSNLECRIRSVNRGASLKASGDAAITSSFGAIWIHLKRNPDEGGLIELLRIEAGSQNSDDLVSIAIEENAFARDVRATRELPGPKGIAQDDYVSASGLVFVITKGPARKYPGSKKTEK